MKGDALIEPIIDPEFHGLIPPLTPEEYEELAADIAERGLRHALTTWEGHDILLDGHNRLDICRKAGIEWRTKAEPFDSRDAAKEWIIRNQFARRNLAPFQRLELSDKLRPILERRARERQRCGPGGLLLQNSGKAVHVDSELAKASGLSRDTIAKGRVLIERAPEPLKRELRAGHVSIHSAFQQITHGEREMKREARRKYNERKIEEVNDPLVAGATFACLAMDPPWRYEAAYMGRSRPDYKTMSLDEIAALPIRKLADPDAHLYLWTTNAFLPKAFPLIEEWGFKYVTCLTWCKPSIGMGAYFRNSSEHVLFAVRGSLPILAKDIGTWFAGQAEHRHSSKPDAFYHMAERATPGPRLDMFGRKKRKGWTLWGEDGFKRDADGD